LTWYLAEIKLSDLALPTLIQQAFVTLSYPSLLWFFNYLKFHINIRFACPDLTSKGGYWAKSLAERYSVENAILHFFVNESGEMYYGVNGVHKGLFLSGINVLSPLWIIVDIYGNSIAVEFVGMLNLILKYDLFYWYLDPAEVQLHRKTSLKAAARMPCAATIVESESAEGSPIPAVRHTQQQHQQLGMTASSSANNLLNTTSSRSPSSRASPMTNTSKQK
jgi:hypothetical protein